MKWIKFLIGLMLMLSITLLVSSCGGGDSGGSGDIGSGPVSTKIGDISISSDEKVNIENYNKTVESYVDSVKGMMIEYQNALSAISAGFSKEVTVETISIEEAYAYEDHLIKAVPYMAKTMLYSRDLIRLEEAIPSLHQAPKKRAVIATIIGLGGLAFLGHQALTAGGKAINKIADKGLDTIDEIEIGSPEHKSTTQILGLGEDATIEEMKEAYSKLDINAKTEAHRNINGEMLGNENAKDRVKEGVVETAPEIAEIGVKLAVDSSQAITGGFFDKVFSTFGVSDDLSAAADFILNYLGADPTSQIKGSLAQTDKKSVSTTFEEPTGSKDKSPSSTVEELNTVANGDFDNLTSEGLEILSFVILQDMLEGNPNATKNTNGSINIDIPERAFLINIKDAKNGDRIQVLNYEDAILLITIAGTYPEFFNNMNFSDLSGNTITLELNPLNEEEEEENPQVSIVNDTTCPIQYIVDYDSNGDLFYILRIQKEGGMYSECTYHDTVQLMVSKSCDPSSGSLECTYQDYYKDGTPGETSHMIDGVLNGDYIEHWSNGNINVKGTFLNGEKDGTYWTYREDSSLLSIVIWVNGEQAESTYYRPDGTVY